MSRAKSLDFYRGRDPRELPAYGMVEAAHYLRLPLQTIRQWLYGRTLQHNRHSRPLIRPASPGTHGLSFVNLLELHVISGIRRDHRIEMRTIRDAIDELEKQYPSPHPLIDKAMLTDGQDLFIEELGNLVKLKPGGQRAMKAILSTYLKRIERDASGLAIRLYPITRKRAEDSPRLIAIDPTVAFGRPVIAGTRIPTAEVADRFKAGDTVDDLLREYDASKEQIDEAIRCEVIAA